MRGDQEAAVTLTFSGEEKGNYEGVLDPEHTRHLLDTIPAALGTYGIDPSWNESGLDGVVIRGSFQPPAAIAQDGTFDTLKHYVARGLGVAVVPGLCVTDEGQARLEIVPIPGEMGVETTYGVVIRADKHRSRLLTDLLRLLGVGGRKLA